MVTMLRHGIAEEGGPSDAARSLTVAGVRQLERVLDMVVMRGWRPGAILHSPLVRAVQTADEVWCRFPDIPREECEALATGDLEAVTARLVGLRDPVIVGHEPALGILASMLIGAPPGAIRLDRAGMVAVELGAVRPLRPGTLLFTLSPRWLGIR